MAPLISATSELVALFQTYDRMLEPELRGRLEEFVAQANEFKDFESRDVDWQSDVYCELYAQGLIKTLRKAYEVRESVVQKGQLFKDLSEFTDAQVRR